MTKLFKNDPREYALALLENDEVETAHMLLAALKYMSHEDIRKMLEANEWSPRFLDNKE